MPGASVPTDGMVESGRSTVDESLLTGESQPRIKTTGSEIIGGSINVDSPLIVRITTIGQDTVLSAILRLLDRAQTEKPKLTRLADRIAGVFVPAVVAFALLAGGVWLMVGPDPRVNYAIVIEILIGASIIAVGTGSLLNEWRKHRKRSSGA